MALQIFQEVNIQFFEYSLIMQVHRPILGISEENIYFSCRDEQSHKLILYLSGARSLVVHRPFTTLVGVPARKFRMFSTASRPMAMRASMVPVPM